MTEHDGWFAHTPRFKGENSALEEKLPQKNGNQKNAMQKKKKKVFLVFLKLGMLDFYKSKIHKTNKKEKQKRKC